jgi:CelD/BcsL family acetyltransferase involved in cellulose biosynthesis
MATAIEIEPIPITATRAPSIQWTTLHRAADLRERADLWRALDCHVSSPMQTLAWIEASADTFADEGRIEVIIGLEGDEVIAAAPFFLRRGGGRQELLNYCRVYEPADFAFRDEQALTALAGVLRQRGRPFFLERLFAASPTIQTITNALGRTGCLMVRPQAATPWIALDESWSAPEQRLSSRRRSDFRRAYRHAEQAGVVRCELLSPTVGEVDGLLDLAFKVERRSWKGEQGTALADGRAGDFYRRYARSTASRGQFRIEFLHVGDQVAAMQLGVVHQNRYWVLKVGYDPQFQRASPGILLMVEAIKRAVAEGLEGYELLGTVEPWIQVWTELERACISLRYYPANWRGAAALAGDFIGKAGRRLAGRTP